MNKKEKNTPEDDGLKLKGASETYECKVPSLRKGIKTNRLPAEQRGSKGVYYLKPADVERFLKESPGIGSIFHPKESAADQTAGSQVGSSIPAEKNRATKAPSTTENSQPANRPRDVSKTPQAGTDTPKKRRRNRRRGRGGKGDITSGGVDHPKLLKSLEGMSTQERLKMVACLNELTAIIASV